MMGDLFGARRVENLLPFDGEVSYQSEWLEEKIANEWFGRLMDSPLWRSDVVKMFGKAIATGRKVIWFGDKGCVYIYSGVEKKPEPWCEAMLEIKQKVESATGEEYNSCLANLYHNGDEAMGWHSDDEVELGAKPVIAVASLGAERKFKFKHKKSKEGIDVLLEKGSLLVMRGATQEAWQHTLPKAKKVDLPRISLTFRKIVI